MDRSTSTALCFACVVATVAGQSDQSLPAGAIVGIVFGVVGFLAGICIPICVWTCVLCCISKHSARQQQPLIVTPAPASGATSYSTAGLPSYSTHPPYYYPTTTTPYPANPPPIPGQVTSYATPPAGHLPPEPSDPTLTKEAPPSYAAAIGCLSVSTNPVPSAPPPRQF